VCGAANLCTDVQRKGRCSKEKAGNRVSMLAVDSVHAGFSCVAHKQRKIAQDTEVIVAELQAVLSSATILAPACGLQQ
jgi:hypothetical protein